MRVLKKILTLLSQRERRLLGVLFVGVLVRACLQVTSIASIIPFLSVVADPAVIQEQPYLHWVYTELGFTSTRSFLIALGIAAFLLLVLSNGFIILVHWAVNRFAWGCNHSLSLRLLRRYLHRPYEYFLTRNSAELGKNVLEEVREITSEMLVPGLHGGANGLAALFMIGFLVYYDPVVAVGIALVLGAAYGGIYAVVRRQLDRKGEVRVASNSKRYQYVAEAFGGIKDVKVQGTEENFLTRYATPSKHFARSQAVFQVFRQTPKFVIEAVAFGGIVLITVYLLTIQEHVRQVIPVLGVYAFAGYRLLPALQQTFHGLASARFNIAALDRLTRDLDGHGEEIPSSVSSGGEALELTNRIRLREVCFTYPQTQQPTLQNVSLEIPAGTRVGVVGTTGAGKTTVIDILLGLLRPQEGRVEVDDVPLTDDTIRRWRQTVGYVPQDIYLADDTVARNIAYGVPDEAVDKERVRTAARRAQIFDFVTDELPHQWDTTVGERGVNLSGGQRQRIGIARALYHSPAVLVFDEATSALDPSTEAQVMEAIYGLEEEITMLIVSHRLQTVRRADKIVVLEEGRKVGEGSYEELMRGHPTFRALATS